MKEFNRLSSMESGDPQKPDGPWFFISRKDAKYAKRKLAVTSSTKNVFSTKVESAFLRRPDGTQWRNLLESGSPYSCSILIPSKDKIHLRELRASCIVALLSNSLIFYSLHLDVIPDKFGKAKVVACDPGSPSSEHY